MKNEKDPNSEKTTIGARVDRLKLATLRAIARRERLPQPLFWSLFHAEIETIKSQRRRKREELKLQFDVDWL